MNAIMTIVSRGLLVAAACLAFAAPSTAADKVTFLTSWFAQAEHGGFYQAKATGLYEKAGLDVTIKMGGPQVNGSQLLLAGETDFLMGYDIQVLKGRESGLPLVTVASSFQFDLQGIMAHDDVADLAALKGKPILISGSSRTTYWPWLRAKYGYTDDQIRAYTFNLQPFFADPTVVAAGLSLVRTVPGAAARRQGKILPVRRRWLSALRLDDRDHREDLAENPDVVARFVKASLEGWR